MLQTNGYMAATRPTGMPRDIEYQVFCRATGKLSSAADSTSFTEVLEAINENLLLWRTIAMDIIDKDNGLPEQLRAQLFYLYEFTQTHSAKVIQRQADVSALIDVNTAIMRGLRQHSEKAGGI